MTLNVDVSKANPQFLVLALNAIAKQLNHVDTTGREQYDIKEILSLPIPLPPLDVQDSITENWRKALESYHSAYKRVQDVQNDPLSQLQEPSP